MITLTATYAFNAPVQQVWDLLMDTEAIGSCLPGCKGLRPLGNDVYEVELGLAVAAIAGTFKGTVSLEQKVPPRSYTLVVEGTGRQGFVNGRAVIGLEEEPDRTRVLVTASAEVGGLIARVGQRLLEGVARTSMDRFYACMAARKSLSD